MHKRIVAALLLFAAGAFAQVAGRLSGSVVDPTGAAVPNASINLYLQGGTDAVLRAVTTSEGLFALTGVRPDTYDVTIDAAGFKKQTLRGVIISPGQENSLPPVKLELGATTETVEVTAVTQGVQTTNAEISHTITNDQVRQLPMLSRSPLALLMTQAGVTSNSRSNTTINGQRVSYSNMTLDGINIQDNYIRTNALDFSPNMLLLDQVGEVSVSTSNSASAVGGGSGQVMFVTPSGTNAYHGSLYWYNRNNKFSAASWAQNQTRTPKSFLNQNQIGGKIGGPIIKDKLLFYTNYEAYRRRTQTSYNHTILTGTARQGIFTYKDKNTGAVQQVNVLQLMGVSIDPTIQKMLADIPGPENINNFDTGDSAPGLLRNTAGDRYNVRNNRDRNNISTKLDYIISPQHMISGTFAWNSDKLDRPDVATDFRTAPIVANDNKTKFLSATWRWSIKPNLTNELRGGFNLAPALFLRNTPLPDYVLAGLVTTNPVNTFANQGRWTNTYNYMDNASWQHGAHNVQFGVQAQLVSVKTFNDAGVVPTYTLGLTNSINSLLPTNMASTDQTAAGNLAAMLAGYIRSYSQGFNVTSRTSGFVPGASNTRRLSLNTYSAYVQDSWKALRRLTVNLGVRYDLLSPIDEKNGLELVPVIQNGDVFGTLLNSNATLDFAGGDTGRPFYNRQKLNFSPNIGLAYDLFGNGRTSLRAGYSLSYVNDDTFRAVENAVSTNAGLSQTVTKSNLNALLANGVPAIPTPTFKVPRTFSDNYALNPGSAFAMTDPNLKTPYVQQWNFGIQHMIKDIVVEVRYVGNHATQQFRGIDYNQVLVTPEFLNEFKNAANNGWAAVAAGKAFSPVYNPSIPGSVPLPMFAKMPSSALTNSSIVGDIQRGEVGDAAYLLQYYGYNGPYQFFQQPYALGVNMLTNYSNSSYNGLQVEMTKRMSRGLTLQANYTFSKVLSDSNGDAQTRFEPFLDNANPKRERARAPFDQTHILRANGIYNLPFGKGRYFSTDNKVLDKIIGGWTVSGMMTWESGAPFSVYGNLGTLNRNGRGMNTVNTTLTLSQLKDLMGVRMTGNGPYYFDPSIINPFNGQGMAPYGQPAFDGQAFFQPAAGTIGTLQRNIFSGPWDFGLDMAILKNIQITETQKVEFRAQSTNALNHPAFYIGDQNISSTTFGKMPTGTMFGARVIEFGLYYSF
jgi:hypothetical protein